jgi:NAD(P)H-hydrate epimerase
VGGYTTIYLVGDPERYRGAARKNYSIVQKLPIECVMVEDEKDLHEVTDTCDCIIDALFGTGLTRVVSDLYAAVIDAMNRSTKPILSIDIPSGINGDSGMIMGTAVRASWTVTFGLPKLGNMLYPGFDHCGRIFVSHISFPPEMYEDQNHFTTSLNTGASLPDRPREAHKGSMGQALFIAGASNYLGAPYFAAMSFLKAGGGYSRLAAPNTITPFIAVKGGEIVFLPQIPTDDGSIAAENSDALLEVASNMDMVVLGPGISLNHETQQTARDLIAKIPVPLLVDGDGITAVSKNPEILKNRQNDTILTPHPGEMSRLAHKDISTIRENRVSILREFAVENGVYTVLKGAHSLIGSPDGQVYINLSGNPGMASAGSGDVLTGTIAAMFGMGMPLPDAVKKGVFIHGLAADLAALVNGEDGITAEDILGYLPHAVQSDRVGFPKELEDKYRGVQLI